MTWQDLAVAVILLLCAFSIGRRIYRFYRKLKDTANPCETCTSDCEIKRLQERRQAHCCTREKKKQKSCCG